MAEIEFTLDNMAEHEDKGLITMNGNRIYYTRTNKVREHVSGQLSFPIGYEVRALDTKALWVEYIMEPDLVAWLNKVRIIGVV